MAWLPQLSEFAWFVIMLIAFLVIVGGVHITSQYLSYRYWSLRARMRARIRAREDD